MTLFLHHDDIGPKPPVTPSIQNIISSIYTTILYNLGEVTMSGVSDIQVNTQTARFNLELLLVLQKKTIGNLTDEEHRLLEKVISSATMKLEQHESGHES